VAARRPVLSVTAGRTRLSIRGWSLVVVLALAAALVAGVVLAGRTEGENETQLSPLPTPASTVTATAGWWGDVTFPAPTSTLTTTVTPEVP
jgi:hypothetical protein